MGKRGPKKGSFHLSTSPVGKDIIHELYTVKELSTKQIANKFSVSSDTVRKWLTFYGIPIKSNSGNRKGKSYDTLYGKEKSEEIRHRQSLANSSRVLPSDFGEKVSRGKKLKNFHPSESTRKLWSTQRKGKNLGSPIYRKSGKTDIERITSESLDYLGISYIYQKYFKGIGTVDFYLNDYDLIVECDSIYWHETRGNLLKDAERDKKFLELGKITLRLHENLIKSGRRSLCNYILGYLERLY